MPVNYPKFDKKIQDQIDVTEMQKARSRPGVIASYDKRQNTAVVILEDHYSQNIGNVIKNVVCPVTNGVQSVAPTPGNRCLVGFRDNNEAKPYIINFYNDAGNMGSYRYYNTVNTGIPNFMVCS
jgi:hypothetical protein